MPVLRPLVGCARPSIPGQVMFQTNGRGPSTPPERASESQDPFREIRPNPISTNDIEPSILSASGKPRRFLLGELDCGLVELAGVRIAVTPLPILLDARPLEISWHARYSAEQMWPLRQHRVNFSTFPAPRCDAEPESTRRAAYGQQHAWRVGHTIRAPRRKSSGSFSTLRPPMSMGSDVAFHRQRGRVRA